VKGAGPIDPKSKETLKLEDSNLANYGSPMMKELKLKVAKTETAWAGAGAAPGVEVWRVEKFIMHRWPAEKNGSFYDGDAYIVLHTYKKKDPEGKDTDVLLYNAHFWLGKDSTQDEQGTAAYKTVELDDLLGGTPVQFREVQGSESPEFSECFKAITILSGGVGTGFKHVTAREYKSKLMRIDGTNRSSVKVEEVPPVTASLNQGEVFVLDGGLQIWQWNGSASTIWEKRKGGEVMDQLITERDGLAKKTILDSTDDDAKFWAALGGKAAITAPVKDKAAVPEAKHPGVHGWSPSASKELYKVDIPAGADSATFTRIVPSDTKVERKHFTTDGVFLLSVLDEHKKYHIFVWVGNGTSKTHQKLAIMFGQEFLTKNALPTHSKIVRVMEGTHNAAFNKCVDSPHPPAKRA